MVASASDFTSDADAPWDDLIDFFTECLIPPPFLKGLSSLPFIYFLFWGKIQLFAMPQFWNLQ